jgi:Tfp pilus assembly protein PilO
MSSLSQQMRMILGIVLAGTVLIAALWFTAIAPKRAARVDVTANVTAARQRVDDAHRQVAEYTAARKQFPGMLSEFKRLDVAVPTRGAISQLLRELQRRARFHGGSLRLAALKSVAATPGTTPATPGATTGTGGLATLPFTFEYTGSYFDLVAILRTVRTSVRTHAGDMKINGRLLTIDGLTFKREPGKRNITATINATAYIAPDATAPAVPAAAAKGGS